jgi:hypothetical protein
MNVLVICAQQIKKLAIFRTNTLISSLHIGAHQNRINARQDVVDMGYVTATLATLTMLEVLTIKSSLWILLVLLMLS